MLTIRKPEQKTSGFRMFPVFKWSNFGSLLIFIFIFFNLLYKKLALSDLYFTTPLLLNWAMLNFTMLVFNPSLSN